MHRFLLPLFAIFFSHSALAQDMEGSSDHPLLGRFEPSTLAEYEAVEYDEQALLVGKNEGERDPYSETLEGAITRIYYTIPEGYSSLQIIRGYRQKLEANGFEIKFECKNANRDRANWCGPKQRPLGSWISNNFKFEELRVLYANRTNDQGRVDVQLSAAKNRKGIVELSAVVVENLEFENKVIDAKAVTSELTAQGKMAFYDILFETGSAALKPSSDATLKIISEVIASDDALDVIVVGHTDNQGSLDANIELSRARAEAVKTRLVGNFAVPGARISSAGVAFLAPVSTNATAEGRALNRRVEIVVR